MHKADYIILKNFDVSDYISLTRKNINLVFNEYSKLGEGKRLTSKEIRYAKKLIALLLIKHNSILKQFENKSLNDPYGFVYCISNPAFNGYFKIGITKNIKSRLNSYQTYDPLRQFKIESYDFFFEARKVEKIVIEKFRIDLQKGEWIDTNDFKTIVKFIRSLNKSFGLI